MKTEELDSYDAQLTKEGFEELWRSQVRKGFGFIQSYRNAEIIHYKEFSKYRYESYEAFAKSRDYKKKK